MDAARTEAARAKAPKSPQQRLRGFVLVLVVDESQTDSMTAALARVYREYDIADNTAGLAAEVLAAAEGAANQVRLLAAARRLRLVEPPA